MPGAIYYFCTSKHSYTLGIYSAFYASPDGPPVRIVPYELLPSVPQLGPGAYIFTDFDRMEPHHIEALAPLVAAVEAGGALVLNRPGRALGRFALLRKLHEAGINRFNVYRLGEWKKAKRFPVFIRAESGHDKPVTALIDDSEALGRAVAELERKGQASPDLMISEFGNAPDREGRYHKYAAFRVGSTIYPQHCFSSRNWWIKFQTADRGEARSAENENFIRDNPHRDQLETIFALAEIDYGRADYCVVDGKVQLFEINTNPTVVETAPGGEYDLSAYAKLHEKALADLLDQVRAEAKISNPLYRIDNHPLEAAAITDELNRGYRSIFPGRQSAGAAKR